MCFVTFTDFRNKFLRIFFAQAISWIIMGWKLQKLLKWFEVWKLVEDEICQEHLWNMVNVCLNRNI